MIRDFDNLEKSIATICVGALPLGKSGILNNRKATAFHLKNRYRQKELTLYYVDVVNEHIMIAENVITS